MFKGFDDALQFVGQTQEQSLINFVRNNPKEIKVGEFNFVDGRRTLFCLYNKNTTFYFLFSSFYELRKYLRRIL